MSLQYTTDIPDFPNFDHVLSSACRLGDTLYISGQTPRDAKGKLVGGGVEAETEQCLRNIEIVLKASGAELKDLAKVTVFLQNMDDFAKMNATYERILPNPKPARSCVQVRNPADCLVEIEAIARAPQ